MTVAQQLWVDGSNNILLLTRTTTTTTTTMTAATTKTTDSVMPQTEIDSSSKLSPSSPETSAFEGLDPLHHFLVVWGVAVVLVALAVVTVVSNSVMLTMFVLRRSVRRCKNIYVASLAAADLGIGLTLPVATLEQVESSWVLQGVPCHLYQTVRCSLLYVSLLSILLISVDRWWSIHYPFTYRARQSKKLAAVAVTLVWLASFVLHVPPVLLWEHFLGTNPGVVLEGYPGEVMPVVESSSSGFSLTTTRSSSLTLTGGGGFVVTGEELSLKNLERRRCELPYELNFSYVLTSSVVLYFFPLLALWVLNCSLYFKITRRKSIKIRRSLSVNDNYLLPFRKSSSESESSPNNGMEGDASCVELRCSEQRQRLLHTARAGRRHTLAFAGQQQPAKFGGGGVGSIYYPSNMAARHYSFRRVSIYEAFSGIGSNLAAVGGGLPNLPRVTSCGRLPGTGGGGGFGFGSGHRQSVCSTSRKQSEDLVKELLVRQDKKAARLLGLLVTVFTLCWLPYTVTTVLRASHPEVVGGWLRDLSSWVLVTNSAINPFLYGLLNAEFRKILRDWFYFRRQSTFRLKHAQLYWSLPGNADSDGLKDAPGVPPHALFATPIKE